MNADADQMARAVCEQLQARGLLIPGVEFRYGPSLVQVLYNQRLLTTFNPNDLSTVRYVRVKSKTEPDLS